MANNSKPLTKTFGQSGTRIYGGIITGEEYSRVLQGVNALLKYDIMRKSDPTVRAILRVCKLPIIAANYTIEPASDDAVDVKAAGLCKQELFERNIVFSDFLYEILTMFDFGFSLFEKTLEVTEFEGQKVIGFKEIASRKQTTIYKWEMTDGQPGVTQQTSNGKFDIPQVKLAVFTNEQEGQNYQGVSLLRSAFKSWDIKDKLDLVNAIALERQAIGIPILQETGANDQASLEAAEESLRKIYANEESYIKVPKNMTVEFLDMKSHTTKEVIPTIKYLDRQISKSVLAQFLELGSDGGSGSRALSTDQTTLFMKAEYAAAHYITSVIQQNIIKQLCDLNFSNLPNGYPKLTINGIEDDDISIMSKSINDLMTAKALTPDAELEDHIRDIMKFPALPEEYKNDYANRPGAQTPVVDPTLDPAKDKKDAKELPNTPKKKASAELREHHDELIQAVLAEFDDEPIAA